MLNMAELICKKIDCDFLISASNKTNYEKIKNSLVKYKIPNIRIIIGNSHDLINSSDILICASGTVTLEVALFKKPMIITYKSSWIEFHLYKMVRLIKFVGLPNILLNKSIVPEFLQDNLSAEILANKTLEIINDKKYMNSSNKNVICPAVNAYFEKITLPEDTQLFINNLYEQVKPSLQIVKLK